MRRLALFLPLLALAPLVAARAEDPATNAVPTFSRRVPLDGFGSAEIAPGWRISYGPDEATLDGIPKWSVCVYETAAPLDNRLLPERWHGLQPCEIAPALVPTNEVRILPVRGKPWLLRLSLEGIGVADGKNVRGEVAMSFHFFREIPRNPAAKTLSLADKAAVETILAESGQPFGDGWDLPEETKRQLEDVLGPPQKNLGFGIARGLWVFPDEDEFEIEYGGIPHAAWNRERSRRGRALSSTKESLSEPLGNAIWGPSVPDSFIRCEAGLNSVATAPATNAPASSESHAENAESAEPKPHAKSAEGAE